MLCYLTSAFCGAGAAPSVVVAWVLSWQDTQIRRVDAVISMFSGRSAAKRPSIWPSEQHAARDEVRAPDYMY